MIKISVITPSVRPEGLELVKKALDRQTFKDYEWIVNDKRYEGGYWGLNRAYNQMIKEANGDLIVSWQDYTFADPDCLEKFWFHYKDDPKVLVTAVGNKYIQVRPYPMMRIWQDPRERDDQGSYYQCFYSDIEFNLCSVPKQALYDVGGFDEGLDFLGFGMDGYSVCDRINSLDKYDFKIDQTIKSYSMQHDRLENWEKFNLIHGGYKARKARLMALDTYPALEYLSLRG